MKKIALFTAVAAASIAFAGAPAMASTLDINLGAAGASQTQNGAVTQVAISAAAAVGHTGDYADVTSTAVDGAQLANVTNDVSQAANYNVNATLTGTSQVLNGAVTQAGLSIAGTGDLGAHSSIASTMANLGQSTTVAVKVHQ